MSSKTKRIIPKFLSRRSIRAWFQPIYTLIHQASSGELEFIFDESELKGDRAIVLIPTTGKYSWADMAIEGTYATLRDLFPAEDYSAVERVIEEFRTPCGLYDSMVVSKSHLDLIRQQLNDFEGRLIRTPSSVIGAAVRRQHELSEMRYLLTHGGNASDRVFQKEPTDEMQAMRTTANQCAQH